jgi:hypothetical protein
VGSYEQVVKDAERQDQGRAVEVLRNLEET